MRDPRIKKILFSNFTIERAIKKLARQLDKEYTNKTPILVAILKGSIPFYASLVKKMKIDLNMDFIVYSSYQGGIRPGDHREIKMDLQQSITGKDVVIVEDVVDTGKTLNHVVEMLKARKPNSIKVVTLVDKPLCREVKFVPDHCCLTAGKEFLVGYGLDFKELYRNKPYIGILDESQYKE